MWRDSIEAIWNFILKSTFFCFGNFRKVSFETNMIMSIYYQKLWPKWPWFLSPCFAGPAVSSSRSRNRDRGEKGRDRSRGRSKGRRCSSWGAGRWCFVLETGPWRALKKHSNGDNGWKWNSLYSEFLMKDTIYNRTKWFWLFVPFLMFDWIECMMGELFWLKVMASFWRFHWPKWTSGWDKRVLPSCIGDSVEGRFLKWPSSEFPAWQVVSLFCQAFSISN